MLPTQQINLSQEEYDKLFGFYKNHEEHSIRQRAHILLLRDKGYGVSVISNSLWLEENYIALYIKAWYHFGFEGFLSDDTEKLFNSIKEIETPKLIKAKPLIEWLKVIERLKNSSKKTYLFFETIILAIATFFLTIFLWFFTKIKAVDFKKFYISSNQNVSNKLDIGKDSNNNIVIQTNVVINTGIEGEVRTETESKIVSTLEDTKKQFLDIFHSQKEYMSNSQMIALFLALNDKIQQIQEKEKRKRILAILATAAAMYVYYNTSIKGALVVFTFLSMSIPIFNVNSCNNSQPNQNEIENKKTITTDSIHPILERNQFGIDSLEQKKEQGKIEDSINRQQELVDSLAMIEVIEEDNNCYYLAKKNSYVSRLIEKDKKDHEKESYFVARHDRDDKYFLIVKVYDDIREAAFQRTQLVRHGFKKSKIVEIEENERKKFGLTLDEFTESKYDDAVSVIYDWELFCSESYYKLTIYHNGLCKLR